MIISWKGILIFFFFFSQNFIITIVHTNFRGLASMKSPDSSLQCLLRGLDAYSWRTRVIFFEDDGRTRRHLENLIVDAEHRRGKSSKLESFGCLKVASWYRCRCRCVDVDLDGSRCLDASVCNSWSLFL